MNEAIQQSFGEIGIKLELQVVELEVLYTAWRQGAAHDSLKGITANNIAYVTSDPLYAIVRFFHSGQIAPVGVNWGDYKSAEVDGLIDQALNSVDVAEQNALMAKVHEHVVNEALLVVHDTNPHAMSPR